MNTASLDATLLVVLVFGAVAVTAFGLWQRRRVREPRIDATAIVEEIRALVDENMHELARQLAAEMTRALAPITAELERQEQTLNAIVADIAQRDARIRDAIQENNRIIHEAQRQMANLAHPGQHGGS